MLKGADVPAPHHHRPYPARRPHGARGQPAKGLCLSGLKETFDRDGFCRIPGFASAGEIGAWADDIQWLVDQQLRVLGLEPSPDTDPIRRLSQSLIALWRAKPQAQAWIYDEVNRRPWIHALAADPKLVGLAQEVLGSAHVGIHPRLNMIMSMPQDEWQIADWHQDRFYGPAHHLVAYMPLHPTGEWNGGLSVALGGHTSGLLPHARFDGGIKTKFIRHPPEVVDGLDKVQLDLDAGELLLFDGHLPHAAGVNRSDEARFALTIRYTDLADPFFVDRGWVWADLAEDGLKALQSKEDQDA
jgi:hypothetical protein